MDFNRLLSWCQTDLPYTLERLRQSVEIESPSGSGESINRAVSFFAGELTRAGGVVKLYSNRRAGNALGATFWTGLKKLKPILVLGHVDTVWELGTLARMPFRIQRGRAFGPGILDMKSGLVLGIEAVRALKALEIVPRSSIRFFLNPDEETGSRAFRSKIEQEAGRARACLVLEPAARGGRLKIARKGVGDFRITVHGRSAHAGIDPEAGLNAILELARQLLVVRKFAQPSRGLTVNIGMIEGGTRPNVVPERASASIDVRIQRARDAAGITRRIFALKPVDPRARIHVTGGINRPPLEPQATKALFRHARRLGHELGLELEGALTGGASDGNFTAALGVPTLDGLGGVGDGAHSRHEHVLIPELPRRSALLAALLATV